MSTFAIGQLGVVFNPRLYNSLTLSAVDLTNAAAVVIEFERPDGTTFEKTATIDSPPTSGLVTYENNSPDASVFEQAGELRFRIRATFTDGDLMIGAWITNTIIN